ncbi:MAG: hypothetical protein KZQ91_01205 [Candidatus Thiodiazotropha sp. (ex Lucinoma borealis)]|nr:hypothetical protein [Candidatus Thiodiazotropha sp. (ex Lucinoma borealis)]
MERVPQANSNLVITLYFFMKMLPMLISGMCIYLGYNLFILGVTGKASLSIESDTISGQLLNAAPGLFFAIGGVVALIFSIVKGVKINFNNGNGAGMDIRNSNFPF